MCERQKNSFLLRIIPVVHFQEDCFDWNMVMCYTILIGTCDAAATQIFGCPHPIQNEWWTKSIQPHICNMRWCSHQLNRTLLRSITNILAVYMVLWGWTYECRENSCDRLAPLNNYQCVFMSTCESGAAYLEYWIGTSIKLQLKADIDHYRRGEV